MKKTQFIELIKNIKSTLVAFISITLFVALGVCIYSGLSWVAEAAHVGTNQTFKEAHFHDLELVFSYGFNDDDLKEIEKVEDVDIAEGGYTCYQDFYHDNKKYQAVILNLTDDVDKILECEGSLPNNTNEIAIDYLFAENNNIKINDTIKFEEANSPLSSLKTILDFKVGEDDINELKVEENIPYLLNNEFKVVGIVKTSRYLMLDTQYYGISPINKLNIDTYFYVTKETFNPNAFLGYVDINIYSNKLNEISYFTDEYKNKANVLSEEVGNVVNKLAEIKNKEITDKVIELTNYGESELNKAAKLIKENEKKIEEGKVTLENAKVELENGLATLNSAQAEYNNAKSEFDEYVSIYNSVKSLYEYAKEKIEFYQGQYDALIADLENSGFFTAVENLCFEIGGETLKNEAHQIIQDFKNAPASFIDSLISFVETQLQRAEQLIADISTELNNAKRQLDDGWFEYYSGLNEYNEGLEQLKSAERQLKQAKIEYAEAKEKFELFKEQSKDIKAQECSRVLRNQDASIITIQTMCNMYEKLRYSMAALFVIVGLLVCYSAISRIVADQTRSIGTKKALGFSVSEITSYYLIYTSITLITGIIMGALFGYYIVEGIFLPVLNGFFTSPIEKYFGLKELIGISCLEIVLLLFTTYFACYKVLKENTIGLLNGSSSVVGKQRFYERSKLWKKMSLLTQTIINNCFNDTKRVLGTIIGIAGSTALIVTAFTFNNNAVGSLDKQYNDYFHFDTIICYNETNDTTNKIKTLLNDNDVLNSEIIRNRVFFVCPDDSVLITHLYVVKDNESFNKLLTLKSSSGENIENIKGLWIGNAYENFYNSKKHETIKAIDLDSIEHDMEIEGFFNHHIANYFAFMDEESYRKNISDDVTSNCFIIDSKNIDIDLLNSELKKIDGYAFTEDFYNTSKLTFDVFASLSNVLVVVYIILSIVMAFLVLLNLLSMFVDEKKRELIVLMINGFAIKDAKRYIYSDTIVLSVIGIIIGVIVGSIIGNLSVAAFDTNATYFMRGVDYSAIIIGAVGSAILTFIVSLISLRKIKKYKLTDINKI